MLGSSVLPDLLETIHTVLERSTLLSMALICAGSVESSTCNSGYPSIFPNVMRSTSGHRLEPPIPRSSACLNPACFTYAAISLKVERCASCSGVIPGQASHLPSSVPVHREASHCQRRRTFSFFFQSSRAAARSEENTSELQ